MFIYMSNHIIKNLDTFFVMKVSHCTLDLSEIIVIIMFGEMKN